MGHRPQVRRSLTVVSIQNELGNANEAGLTELTGGQVWSPKVDSLDSLDSIDSIESQDSLDSLDSLRPTHSLSLSPLSLSSSLLNSFITQNSRSIKTLWKTTSLFYNTVPNFMND
jgi:hypothetical protein